jgi:hypothetical protein
MHGSGKTARQPVSALPKLSRGPTVFRSWYCRVSAAAAAAGTLTSLMHSRSSRAAVPRTLTGAAHAANSSPAPDTSHRDS